MARILRYNDDCNLVFNNKKSDDFPLLINTCGYYEAVLPFETYNSIGRDDFYLMYIVNGQLNLEINGKVHAVNPGGLAIFPPNHKYKYNGNPPTHYLYVHFTGSYADRFLKECGFNDLPCVIEGEFSLEIQSMFNKLIDTFLYNEPLAIHACALILQEIILDVAKRELDKANISPLKSSLTYIHSFYTNKIDIPHLAKIENLSNSRYVTVFRKQMGKSPNEYIIDLRIQFAKNLIKNTNMSIRQISERVGYTDQYFFSRLFKKHVGISPQKYRKEQLL